MKKRLLASLLAIVMVLGTLPMAAFAADEVQIHCVDMTSYVNSDTIGEAGGTINPDTWFYGNAAKKNWGINPGNFHDGGKLNFVSWGNHTNMPTGMVLGAGADAVKAGVNDAAVINSTETVTIDLLQNPTNEIRFAATYGEELTLNIKVDFIDNTSETHEVYGKKFQTTWSQSGYPYPFAVYGSNNYSQVRTSYKPDENNKLVSHSPGENGINLYSFNMTDTTKKVKSITFSTTATNGAVNLYGVAQYYTIVEEGGEEVTPPVDPEVGEAVDGQIHYIDISSEFDSDTIASFGTEPAEKTTEALWHKGIGNIGGLSASKFGDNEIVTFTPFTKNGVTYDAPSFKIPMAGRAGGVADSIHITPNTTKTFELEPVYTSVVKLAIHKRDFRAKAVVYVTYEDGTNTYVNNDTCTTYNGQSVLADAYSKASYGLDAKGWGWTSWNTSNVKEYAPVLETETIDNGNGTTTQIKKDENGNTNIVSSTGTTVRGAVGYELKTDPTKKIKSISLKNCNSATADRNIFLYAISQYEVMNEDLVADITAAEEITNTQLTEEDIVVIEAAEAAMEILKGRNYTYDWTTLETLIAIKKGQEFYSTGVNYINIDNYINADTIVTMGGTVPENFAGPTGKLYNGGSDKIPTDGILTIANSTKEDYTFAPSPAQVGWTYKLSGNYKATGNDAIKVDKTDADGVTVAIHDSSYVAKAEQMGVIIADASVGGNGRDKNGTVYATVTYTDGTTDSATIKTGNYNAYYTAHRFPIHKDTMGKALKASTDTNTFVETGSDSTKFISAELKINPAKVVESINFNCRAANDYYVLAISEFASTTEALVAKITAAEAITAAYLSEADIATIEAAEEAMAILKGRNYTHDWTALENLIAKKNQQIIWTNGINYIDISNEFNADTIANIGETTTSALWFNGAGEKTGFLPSIFGSNDVVTFPALSSDYDAASFNIPVSGRAGGEKDAVVLTNGESVTIPLDETFTNTVEFAIFTMSNGNTTVTINYADGTTETASHYMQNDYHTEQYNGYYGFDAEGKFGWNSWSGANNGKTWPKAKAEDVQEDGSVVISGNTITNKWGIKGFEFRTDSTKKVSSVTVKGNTASALYAVTQYIKTNEELKTIIDTAKAITNTRYTDAEIAAIEAAAAVVPTAIERSMGTAVDYADVTAMAARAKLQKAENSGFGSVEIAADADTIGKAGQTVDPETWFGGYAYNADGTWKTNENYWGVGPSNISGGNYTFNMWEDGAMTTNKVTIPAVTNAANAQVNDAIIVAKTEPKTVSLLDVNTNTLYIAANGTDQVKIDALVTYTDGTTKEKRLSLHRYATVSSKRTADGYLSNGYDVYYPNTENVLTKDGTNRTHGIALYTMALDLTKKPVSISFTYADEATGKQMLLYGIGQDVATNDELAEIAPLNLAGAADVTAENANEVIRAGAAAKALMDREAYSYFAGDEDATNDKTEAEGVWAWYEELIAAANEALKPAPATELSFAAEFSDTVDETTNKNQVTASFTMTNTTANPQPYVFVMAAYLGDKLVDVEVGEAAELAVETENDTSKSISIDKQTDGTTIYKVFVWDGLKTMKPLYTKTR